MTSTDSLPRQLGRYELLDRIEGASRVYRARDAVLGRVVALRVLREGEVYSAVAVAHPSLVEVFDVGEMDGIRFVTTELVLGRSLRACLAEAPPMEHRAAWLVSLAEAIAASHAAGVARDGVALDDVMVRAEDGRVKLLSGGHAQGPAVARALDDQAAWARLACVVLAGESFTGGDAAAAMSRLPGLDPRVSHALLRAQAEDAAARFASMEELLRALPPAGAWSEAARFEVLVERARLGAYRIVRALASEGARAVYAARDEVRGRDVALLVVPMEDDGERAHRLRAARVAAALEHPSIARVYEAGIDGGRLFVALEPLLRIARCDRRSLADAARGVAFAHKRGIAHGALDRLSLWLATDGTPRVIGFGTGAKDAIADDLEGWQVMARRAGQRVPPGRSLDEQADALEGETDPRAEALDAVDSPGARGEQEAAQAITGVTTPPTLMYLSVLAAVLLVAVAVWSAIRRTPVLRPADVSPVAGDSPSMRSSHSPNVEAQAAYDAAMQSLRDVSFGWAANLERATALDPAFAAAHLRRVLYSSPYEDVREHYNRALALRGALDDHDRALLDAYADWMSVPPSLVGTERKLSGLTEREPGDLESLYLLCKVRYFATDYRGAIAACDELRRRDGSSLGAVRMAALARLSLNEVGGALEGYGECIAKSPAATVCLKERADALATEGRCADALLDVRRLLALDPDTWAFQELLAAMLQALGEPAESVEIAIARAVERVPGADRALEELRMRAQLALLQGDFVRAEQELAQAEEAAVGVNASVLHEAFRRSRVLLAVETGAEERALALARSYWAQRSAFTRYYDGDDGFFARVTEYRLGKIGRNTLEKSWNEWLHAREVAPARGRMPPALEWGYGLGAASLTERDAREALALLPRFLPMPGWRPPRVDLALGETLLRVGDAAGAVKYLDRAASSCFAWYQAFDSVHAQLLLGEARERQGDRAGACAAYGGVVARWGRSRSVSAEQGRGAIGRLQCAAPLRNPE